MRKLLFFLGIIILASCTSNSIYKKPKDLIPKDTMIALLTDLYISNTAYYEKTIHSEKKVNYAPFIYNKYKIDSVRFKSSNFYYTSKIDEYHELYKQINDRFDKQILELQKELRKTPDSINKDIEQKFNIE